MGWVLATLILPRAKSQGNGGTQCSNHIDIVMPRQQQPAAAAAAAYGGWRPETESGRCPYAAGYTMLAHSGSARQSKRQVQQAWGRDHFLWIIASMHECIMAGLMCVCVCVCVCVWNVSESDSERKGGEDTTENGERYYSFNLWGLITS